MLINLGTPDKPTPRAVKRYLLEFLTDPRVIDRSWLFRNLLVRGIIVPNRFKESTKLYSSIWTSRGSPIKVYGKELSKKLNEQLGKNFIVKLAMRYQNPSIKEVLRAFQDEKLSHLMIFPLFPQYASATTGSIYQEVFSLIQKWWVIPALTCVHEYAGDPDFIQALCHGLKKRKLSDYDHILFSYHGLPEKQLKKADRFCYCFKHPHCCHELNEKNQSCYGALCHLTTRKMVEALNLDSDHYTHCYQSRLGKDPWLKPYLGEVLDRLGDQKKKRVLIFCPAFSADCLETLDEVAQQYQAAFQKKGGKTLDLVEGLNARDDWVEALKKQILRKLPSFYP